MHIIIDLALVAIVAFSAWKGYRKGLILGLSGILALIIAFFGARYVSDNYSQEFVSMLEPFVSGVVDSSLDRSDADLIDEYEEKTVEGDTGKTEAEAPAASKSEDYSVTYETLKNLGILRSSADSLTKEITDSVQSAGKNIRSAIVSTLSEKITYVITFALVFIMIVILFTVLANIINLAFKLPGLDLLNGAGGLIFGLIKGMIFVYLIAWILSYLGVFIGKNLVDDTIFLKFLMDHNLLVEILKG
jgi:uncharacterized membrane protein required for colicin V production